MEEFAAKLFEKYSSMDDSIRDKMAPHVVPIIVDEIKDWLGKNPIKNPDENKEEDIDGELGYKIGNILGGTFWLYSQLGDRIWHFGQEMYNNHMMDMSAELFSFIDKFRTH